MSDDILIRILTAYQKGGVEEAKRSLKELSAEAKTTQRATEDLSASTKKSSNEHANATRALAGLNAASAAGRGSIMGLAQVMNLLGESAAAVAAKVTLVAGAFTAGWSLGTQIDKWLKLSQTIADTVAPLEKVASIQDRIKGQLAAINAASIAKVTNEFDALSATLAETLSQMDQINRVKNQLAGAETEAQLAEIEAATPPGPERDRAILEARRKREQASIDERRAQARAKFAAAEQALAGGQAAVEAAESAEGDARKETMLLRRADAGSTVEARTAARLRLEGAERASAAARARLDPLSDAHGMALMETSNTMRALAIEERTSKARYTSGNAALTADQQAARARAEAQAEAERARAEAQAEAERARVRARQQALRERTESEMLDISRNATRSALTSQRDDLADRAESLRASMPAARVTDLRARAAGTYRQAESSVAAVASALDAITAKLKLLEDKIKNLPR
jgi:hypothetical protein